MNQDLNRPFIPIFDETYHQSTIHTFRVSVPDYSIVQERIIDGLTTSLCEFSNPSLSTTFHITRHPYCGQLNFIITVFRESIDNPDSYLVVFRRYGGDGFIFLDIFVTVHSKFPEIAFHPDYGNYPVPTWSHSNKKNNCEEREPNNAYDALMRY